METAVFLIAVFTSVFLSTQSSKTLQKSSQKICLVIGIIFKLSVVSFPELFIKNESRFYSRINSTLKHILQQLPFNS